MEKEQKERERKDGDVVQVTSITSALASPDLDLPDALPRLEEEEEDDELLLVLFDRVLVLVVVLEARGLGFEAELDVLEDEEDDDDEEVDDCGAEEEDDEFAAAALETRFFPRPRAGRVEAGGGGGDGEGEGEKANTLGGTMNSGMGNAGLSSLWSGSSTSKRKAGKKSSCFCCFVTME